MMTVVVVVVVASRILVHMWLVVAPVAEVTLGVVPLNGNLLSLLIVPKDKAAPFSGQDFRRNFEHQGDKVARRAQEHFTSLADDGHGYLLDNV